MAASYLQTKSFGWLQKKGAGFLERNGSCAMSIFSVYSCNVESYRLHIAAWLLF